MSESNILNEFLSSRDLLIAAMIGLVALLGAMLAVVSGLRLVFLRWSDAAQAAEAKVAAMSDVALPAGPGATVVGPVAAAPRAKALPEWFTKTHKAPSGTVSPRRVRPVAKEKPARRVRKVRTDPFVERLEAMAGR